MKTKLILIFCLASFASIAQDTPAANDSAFFASKTKIELTDIYLNEVNRVVNKIPLIAFESVPGDVPENEYTKKKFKGVKEVESKYNAKIIDSYNVLIPYADKSQIIEAIIYLQSIK